jgi:hypothetical protein
MIIGKGGAIIHLCQITSLHKMIVIKVIIKLIKQGEEEWKQQQVRWKAKGLNEVIDQMMFM